MKLQKVRFKYPISTVTSHLTFNLASVSAADIISCVEFNHDGDLLATGDKGGRVVIFQRDPVVSIEYYILFFTCKFHIFYFIGFTVQNFST